MENIMIDATVIREGTLWGKIGTVTKINKYDAYKNMTAWSKSLDFKISAKKIEKEIEAMKVTNRPLYDRVKSGGYCAPCGR